MKPELAIVCIEDEAEVLESIVMDLEIFEDQFFIEPATSVQDARLILDRLTAQGIHVALFICDHLMPGTTGVEFMVGLSKQHEFRHSRKMLLTGQAGLEDTVKAVNEAGLDFYLAKPWKREQLQAIVRDLLTGYVAENVQNVLPYMISLDSELLSDVMRNRKTLTDL